MRLLVSRWKDLEHFLADMRARYPSLQVRSDNKEALRHVLKERRM